MDSKGLYNIMVKLMFVFLVIGLIFFGINKYIDKQIEKENQKEVESKMPIIEERINDLTKANDDINHINKHFEYKGINFVELYVEDTWFNNTDIEKKRFVKDVRDNIHVILVEEGFIKSKDRLGIYVYSLDNVKLAESGMQGDIKLIE